jgi:hypothetical protein
MKRQSKLNPQEQAQAHLAEQQTQQPATLEFDTPEQMLRHDASHTPVPPNIATRLKQSLAELPPPARPWWRRLFGLGSP